MRTIAYLLRTERTWLRSWLSLALLLAVVGGAVLAVGAAARRTDTAYPRFLAAENTSDVFLSGNDIGPLGQHQPVLDRIAALPQVQDSGFAYFLVTAVSTPSGRLLTIDSVSPVALADTRLGSTLDHFKVLDGQAADPARPDQAEISFPLAQSLGLHVGDRLTVRPLDPNAFSQGQPPADGLINRDRIPLARDLASAVRITGIVATPVPGDFPPLKPGQLGSLYLTPAYVHRYAGRAGAFVAMAATLKHGAADLPAFQRAAEALGASQQVEINLPGEHEAVVQNSLHLEALGLGVLAALAALVLLLVLSQGVARRIVLGAGDNAALRALGATRPQLFSAAMARAAAAAVAGAVGAAVVATALSPLSPLGLARNAEPHPGVDLDVAVVLGGALALALLVVLVAAVPAWRAAGAGADDASERGSRLADALARASFPVTAVAGVRLALERARGRGAAPVRGAIVACTVGALTIAGALSFNASLDHLLDTPHLYGWTWDALVGNSYGADQAARAIAGRSWVAADATGTQADVEVDGSRAAALAMDPVKGDIGPVVTSGRAPRSDGEILLGSQTDAKARIGQTVTVHVGDTAVPMTLVGRGVLPVVSDTARLGVGAWMRFAALHRLVGQGAQYDTLFVRFNGDAQQGLAQMTRVFGVNGVQTPQKPDQLIGFGDLPALPAILGGVLAAGAIATLAHAVLTSVRRRRRELAIFKTLGFVRGQVALTVAWQTTTVVAIAVAVGVPLGVAAGRWAWTLFAGQQGVVAEPVTPLAVALLVPAALLLGNLVAAIPGRFAARTSPALVLRTE